MNRMEELVAQRVETRHRIAAERTAAIQEAARAQGIEITLVGCARTIARGAAPARNGKSSREVENHHAGQAAIC